MNKKLKNYAVLAASTIAILPSACKEEDINDVNIEDKTVNLTFTATGPSDEYSIEDSVDINNDGLFDFEVYTGGATYYDTFYGGAALIGKTTDNQLLTNDLVVDGDTSAFLTPKNSGDKINAASSNWLYYGYAGYTYGTDKKGIAGAGDKFIGFKFGLSDGPHYGWMKINLSTDYKTFKIIELAYHKTANTEIAVGAK